MNNHGLCAFIGKQAAKFALLIVAISMLTFLLVAASPIDPVKMNTGQAAYANMSPEKGAQLGRRGFGLTGKDYSAVALQTFDSMRAFFG